MTLKRTYSLNSRKITHHYGDLLKTCLCVLLVLLVICGLIGLTLFIVKKSQSNSEENYGHIDYHVGSNNEVVQTNLKLIRHPGIRNDYMLTSVEDKMVATSNTAEFTSTTIESPISTSTMSPKEVPARYLIINTTKTIEVSDYSTDGSSNDQLTTKSVSNKDYFVKRSTDKDIVNDAPHVDYIDAYIQSSGEISSERPTDTDKNTTPKTGLEAQRCSTNVCKQSTSRMLALVNHTAAPCEDFYLYACGGFEINHFKEFSVNDHILESLPGLKRI